ncbi:SubName: Full=Uncharacterized protein {ECO:0000313/EMBL:CCA69643.1} [Serendipita indica DSM 11827]|nr:SubName: Full=Uncharacterized protein {ECO:0000313/EMBL:CCA69643.1} [Serendipita indica DSM 11827]
MASLPPSEIPARIAPVKPMDAQTLLDILADIQRWRYGFGAGTTVLFYDLLLTFDKELDYIWRKGFTGLSVLYLMNRYLFLPFIVLTAYEFSNLRPSGVLAISTWLLSLRVISLYHRQRRIVLSIYILYAIVHGTSFAFNVTFAQDAYPTIQYSTDISLCRSIANVALIRGGYFTPVVVLELYILILQIMHHYRRREHGIKAHLSSFDLVQALYRDGYMYLLLTLLLRLSTSLINQIGKGAGLAKSRTEFPLTIVFASRFHLRLQEHIHRPPASTSEFATITHSSDMESTQRYTSPNYQRTNGHGQLGEIALSTYSHSKAWPLADDTRSAR